MKAAVKLPEPTKKASCGEHTEDMLSVGQRVTDLVVRSEHFLPTKVLHRSTSQRVLRQEPFRQKFHAFCGACDQPLKEILSFCEGHMPACFPFWPGGCSTYRHKFGQPFHHTQDRAQRLLNDTDTERVTDVVVSGSDRARAVSVNFGQVIKGFVPRSRIHTVTTSHETCEQLGRKIRRGTSTKYRKSHRRALKHKGHRPSLQQCVGGPKVLIIPERK